MNPSEPISIFFACNDAYAVHAGAMMTSVLRHTCRTVRFYLLHQDVSEDSQSKLRALPSQTPYTLECLKIDRARFGDFSFEMAHISIEGAFRFLIPQLCPALDKAVYLDCDLIVRTDIADLWDEDVSQVYAGVVEDSLRQKTPARRKLFGGRPYFNSGVLLLNLARIRADLTLERFLDIERAHRDVFRYQDQDVLNAAFGDQVRYLPLAWNATAPIFRKKRPAFSCGGADIEAARLDPHIVHFTGPDKPWKIPSGCMSHPYAAEYFLNLRATPFAAREADFRKGFCPASVFFSYWARHPVFFLRPAFFKARRLRRRVEQTCTQSDR